MPANSPSFENFKLNKQLLEAIREAGYVKPTPIQEKAIPLALAGHDLLGIAQTGTGKTAAYALPLLMKVKYAQGSHPRALVLAPTRELVMQIEGVFVQLARYTDLRILALYGGLGPKTQIEKLGEGTDIIVATPGRFLDLYGREALYVRDIKTMVLDEADKMMDMGFLPQIRAILEIIPVKRQNLLFSATFSQRVETISHEFLEFPEKIEIAPQATTADTVAQVKYHVPNIKTKIKLLEYLLQDEKIIRAMVFTRSKLNAEAVLRVLGKKFPGKVRVIHANKGQNTRINTMEEFKSGLLRVLVATDVAARGLDIGLVSHVINFDVPLIYEDYVHRIGRSGRAENEGAAMTFINPAEEFHFERIQEIIRLEVPLMEIPEAVEVSPTPFAEQQAYAKEIDNQYRKADPDFKGAFHEKKSRPKQQFREGKARGNKHRKVKRNRNQLKSQGKRRKK